MECTIRKSRKTSSDQQMECRDFQSTNAQHTGCLISVSHNNFHDHQQSTKRWITSCYTKSDPSPSTQKYLLTPSGPHTAYTRKIHHIRYDLPEHWTQFWKLSVHQYQIKQPALRSGVCNHPGLFQGHPSTLVNTPKQSTTP